MRGILRLLLLFIWSLKIFFWMCKFCYTSDMLQFHTAPYFQILQNSKYCCWYNDRYLYNYIIRLVNNDIILIIDTFMLTVSLWTERDISGVWMEFPFFSMHSFNHFESSRTWQWVQISRRSSFVAAAVVDDGSFCARMA